MRIVYQALVLAFVVIVAPNAIADTLDFTLTGQGNNFAFFNFDNLIGQTSDIRFFNDRTAGFQFSDILGINPQGDQFYTGMEASPTFLTAGTAPPIEGDDIPHNLKIKPEGIPEPPTLALLAAGAAASLYSISRRRTP